MPLGPMESYPSGETYRCDQDLSRAVVVEREMQAAREGKLGVALFAPPAESMGPMSRFSSTSSRTASLSRGDGVNCADR